MTPFKKKITLAKTLSMVWLKLLYKYLQRVYLFLSLNLKQSTVVLPTEKFQS